MLGRKNDKMPHSQSVSNQRAKLCPNRFSCELLQTHEIPATGFHFCTDLCNFLYLFVTGKLSPGCRRERRQAVQREGDQLAFLFASRS